MASNAVITATMTAPAKHVALSSAHNYTSSVCPFLTILVVDLFCSHASLLYPYN